MTNFYNAPKNLFLLLPEHLLVNIFILTDPICVSNCRLVCRAFNDLIKRSSACKFMVEAKVLEYVPATVSRALGAEEKLDLFRRHIFKLYFFSQNIKPTYFTYPVLSKRRRFRSDFCKGHYTEAFTTTSGSATRFNSLEIVRLASDNTGYPQQRWSFNNLGEMSEFRIEPDFDLLVLLQPLLGQRFRIYIRSIRTGEEHRFAARPMLECAFSGDIYMERATDTHILGHLLAVLFHSPEPEKPDSLIIWNWNTGIRITHIEVEQPTSFAFLSESMFILSRRNIARNVDCFSAWGSFEVYAFGKHWSTPHSPLHLASLWLPVCPMDAPPLATILRSSPNLAPGCLPQMAGYTGAPKVYESRDAHILGIELQHPNGESYGMLFADGTIIRDMVAMATSYGTSPDMPVDFSWEEWGNGLWAPPHMCLATPGCAIDGNRIVSRFGRRGKYLMMLDLDMFRVNSIRHSHKQMCNQKCLLPGCGATLGPSDVYYTQRLPEQGILDRAVNLALAVESTMFFCSWIPCDFQGHNGSSKIFMDEENGKLSWYKMGVYARLTSNARLVIVENNTGFADYRFF